MKDTSDVTLDIADKIKSRTSRQIAQTVGLLMIILHVVDSTDSVSHMILYS